jgi:hypothetical protein
MWRHVVSRSVVGVAACLATSSVATGLVGSPNQAKPEVERREHAIADHAAAGWSRVLDVELGPEMVGFTWDVPAAVELRVRGERQDGTWTDWVDLDSSTDEGPDRSEAASIGTVGPAWLGHDLRSVEVHLGAGAVDHLVMHEIDSEPAAPSGIGPSSASALPAPPPIITRAQWGADESWRSVNAGCGTPNIAENARYVILHHTAGSNDYQPSDSAALVRGIYNFHVFGNGWCDIAYNFLVDKYGQIFEGRFGGIFHAVIGGHTGGFNTGSIGVSVLGDLSSVPLSDAAYTSIVSLLTFKMGHHGIDPWGTTDVMTVSHPSSRYPAGQLIRVQTVTAHGDLSTTGCPGRLRERISSIRSAVAAGIASNDRDVRLVADWDGNGTSTPGVYQNGWFYYRSSNSHGPVESAVHYGAPGYVPVVGDWDGNGTDTVGVYVDGMWYLRNSNSPGPPDVIVHYGMGGYVPVVGDWDGDGRDGIGVYVSGSWYLRETASAGAPARAFAYGTAGYQPVVGDWDATGGDGVGVFTDGYHYLRNALSAGAPDAAVWHGDRRDRAVAGDWNADGRDTIGINRGAYWYLRNANSNGLSDLVFWF